MELIANLVEIAFYTVKWSVIASWCMNETDCQKKWDENEVENEVL